MKLSRILLLPLVALALGLAVAADAGPAKKAKGQKLYKWVDDKGVTHFGNSIPPEYAGQGGEQIDKSGQTVRTIEAEKTPEELAAAEREKEEQEAAERAAAERARQDKVLLGTYGSLDDLKRAHDAKLAAIQGQATLASGTVANLERELLRLERQERTAKDAGKPVPEKLAKDIAKHRAELLANQRFVFEKQSEIDAANAQYERDRARLIELKGLKN